MFLLTVGETLPTPPPPHLPPPPPPVPPRRRKKKLINAEICRDEEKRDGMDVKMCAKRIDRKRLPPPPPPYQIPRKTKTKFVDKNEIQTRIIIHEESLKIDIGDERSEEDIVSLQSSDHFSHFENNILKTSDERLEEQLKLHENTKRESTVSESIEKNDFKVDEDPKKELKVDERTESDSKVYESPKRGFKVDYQRPRRELKIGESPLSELEVSESQLKEFKFSESPVKELKVAESPSKEFKVAENPKSNLKINENSEKNDEPFIVSPRYGDIVRKKEFNKYPPLFFTLDDLRNVITDDNSTIENRSEETSIEENPIKNVTGIESKVEKEVDENSFVDNNITMENEICFRVTPTNFPFEKCLDRWKTSLEENEEFGIEDRNSFIFENYIDRSNRLNVRRSRSSMCYDIIETDGNNIIEEHTATKVRFVIESPSSSSTPDDLDDDSFPNVSNEETSELSINNHQLNQSDTQIFDKADLFGDVPFGSLLNKKNNTNENSEIICRTVNLIKDNLESENNQMKSSNEDNKSDEFTSDNTLSLFSDNCFTEKEIDEFKIEHNCSSQKLSMNFENIKNNKENENVDYILENNQNILDDQNDQLHSKKELNKNERRKICLTESVRSFMNDDSLVWDESDEDEDETFIDSNCLKLDTSVEVQSEDSSVTRIEESKEEEGRRGSILTVPSFQESNDKMMMMIVDDSTSKETMNNNNNNSKPVPVNVRRNSFLETMLTGGEIRSNWMNCEIVETHPKNNRSNSIEELNNQRDSNLLKLNKQQNVGNNDKNSLLNEKRMIEDDDIISNVKNNVLNELISNFSTIKLRSVMKDDDKFKSKYSLNNVESVISDKKDKIEEEVEELEVEINGKKDDVTDDDDDEDKKKMITANQIAVERIQAEIKETRQLDEQMMMMTKNKNSEIRKKNFEFDLNHTYIKDSKIIINNDIEDNLSSCVREIIVGNEQVMKINMIDDDDDLDETIRNEKELDLKKIMKKTNHRTKYDDDYDDDDDLDETIRNEKELDLKKIMKKKNHRTKYDDDYDDDDDSVDNKCAIIREKTPIVITHCNNDDNNRAITTPVDLSNDQSLADHDETLTIIPGSVKNFVKYYEIIRQEKTTAFEDSKINDRKKMLVRSKEENKLRSNVSNKIRNFEYKEQSDKPAARTNYNEVYYKEVEKIDEKKNDFYPITSSPELLTNDISYTMIVKKVVQQQPNDMKIECEENSLGSSINGFDVNDEDQNSVEIIHRKKSVQFSSEQEVMMIRVQDNNHQDDHETTFSQPVKQHHLTQEVVPGTDYQKNSGINRIASNVENNNTRLVFYCTV
ncbi:PREDICTED: uncharacterized protein PF11_0213-like [Polistes canadensis]|uniref:uncharacterized protein PF11_0213-like n=1 Tax=Polistes canadensis TaxID=91411 RepID=UPI000718CD32|nr:PREDICTED: uncharacterized protein PF11_0213-like [Polistes canadensis]